MRVLGALAAGLAVGVILIESVLAGLSTLLPESMLRVSAADGFGGAVTWPLLPIPALVWILGGLAGGTMAAALAPRPGWGLALGALMSLPAIALVGLVTPGNPLALLAAALPVTGSAAGSVLVARLRQVDATVSAPGQSV